ncbi:MAG: hypothetical protein IJU50_01480 [Lachnospiraceae bacterium]|nr:hypothetical protein [Lachnospiraceae bacterium]
MNRAEIVKMQTEKVERLIFLEDLRSIPDPPESVKALIEKYERLTKSDE